MTTRLHSTCLLAALAALGVAAQADAPRTVSAAKPTRRVAAPVVRPVPLAASRLPRRSTTAPRGITLNFSGAEVRDVLNSIADYAKVDVVVTPGAKGSVSLNLRNRTPEQAVRLAAAAAGLTATHVGGAWIVGPAAEVRTAVAEFGESDVIPVQFASPADAVEFVGRVAPSVKAEAAKGAVVLSGLPEDLAVAREALRRVDVKPADPKPVVEAVSVKTAEVEGVAALVRQAYPDALVAIQGRTLLVSGASGTVEAAVKTINHVDAATPVMPVRSDVMVVALKYLNASTASAAIKQAVPDIAVTVAPEPVAPPPAAFNPLSGGFSAGQGGQQQQQGGQGQGMGMGQGGAAPQPLARATRLILMGPKAALEAAKSILEQTDVAQPMVRIEAVLYEINSGALDDSGFTSTASGDISFLIPGGPGLSVDGGAFQRSPIAVSSKLKALVTSNRAKILAQPNVSAIDNEDASIFIGDLVRFRGSTFTPNNGGAIQGVDAIPVGIALLLRPRIHPSGEVTLKVHPVVSTVTDVTSDGLPQTASREADTTVRLKPGEELVIGGLDRTERITNWQKLPILGDLPIFGPFFRGRFDKTAKTRIVVVIRAFPVSADEAPDHKFHLPGDAK
ncbi:MAG: hypothetical protein ACKO5K_17340 [Armatimonadota bacterium]